VRKPPYVLTSVNPLASRVDLGVCLNLCHDGRGRNIDLAGSFDDPLKCDTHVALPL